MQKGSLTALLNPFGQAWKNMRRAKASGLVKESNMSGDGLTLGGTSGKGCWEEVRLCSGTAVGCVCCRQWGCHALPLLL